MLQGGDLVAQAVVGQGAEIVPSGIPLGAVLQRAQRLCIAAEADVLEGRLLIGIAASLAVGLLAIAAEGIIAVGISAIGTGITCLLGILDPLVGIVDLQA